MVEQKAFRGSKWAAFGMEQLARTLWERFTLTKAWARSVLEDAESERQNGADDDWQQETPYIEELQLVRHTSDLHCEGILMRRTCEAVKSEIGNLIQKYS